MPSPSPPSGTSNRPADTAVGGNAEANALVGAGSLPPNIAKLGEAALVEITFLVSPLA